MLVSHNDLKEFSIKATDGRTGHADDFYFDDVTWQVRYLVTRSGFLFTKRQGLVSAKLLGMPDLERRELPVSLTQEQLDDAVDPDAHPPVSEQRTRDIQRRQFDLWPHVVLGVPGTAYTPVAAEYQLFGDPATGRDIDQPLEAPGDPHLRSMAEVSGYSMAAKDGEVGSIIDFLVDPEEWQVKYIVADTGNWLPGRQVAIVIDWITGISWADRRMVVKVSQDAIQSAPEISEIDELKRSNLHLAFTPYGTYAGFYV